MRPDVRIPVLALLLGCLLLFVGVAAAGYWIFDWHDEAGKAPVSSDVVVVDAPGPASDKSVSPNTAIPAPVAKPSSSTVAATHVRQAYSMLSAVALECGVDRCTLRGTIRPPTGQADLDKRQEMLLGGLAAVLAADGYHLVVPFRMDEIDDNTFFITASLTLAHGKTA